MTRASDPGTPSPGSLSLATLSREGRGLTEQDSATLSREGRGLTEQGSDQPSPLAGEGAAHRAAGEGLTEQVDRKVVVRLVEDRLVARHLKNVTESDRIRDQLAAMGIVLTDHEDGTTSWEVKR
jgi:cysteinyl-tRNA synthetase